MPRKPDSPQHPNESQVDEIDKILERLYNAGWVEGNSYDDAPEQLGLDTEPRSSKELRRCANAKQAIENLLTKAELRGALNALDKAHRANNSHDTDNATDEYIDDLYDELTKQLTELEKGENRWDSYLGTQLNLPPNSSMK